MPSCALQRYSTRKLELGSINSKSFVRPKP
jgi:hypothetical protein